MNILKIKETCFYSRDLELVKEFYHRLLGLEIISEVKDKHVFFRAGASVLLCFNPDDSQLKISPPAHFGSGRVHFAFEVPQNEYDSTKKNILAKGVRITDEVTWQSGKKSFYFEDLEHNVLEVVPDSGIWE